MTTAERIVEAMHRAQKYQLAAEVRTSSVLDRERDSARIFALLAIEARMDEANAIAGSKGGM